MTVLAADWDAPRGVKAFTTFRSGGTSRPPFDSFNLGGHVGDDADRVQQNRRLVRESRGWKTEPLWLSQVHGTTVVTLRTGGDFLTPPEADGAVTTVHGQPLVVMTADCLPVVACDRQGTVVGAFHAGWKGLLAGVLEAGVRALERPVNDLLVWFGPAIGPNSYQVGPEVRDAYLAADASSESVFRPDGPGHWLMDLAGAAVLRLQRLGVTAITRSAWDTYRDADLFFSHRRQAPCGRLGTFICLEPVLESPRRES